MAKKTVASLHERFKKKVVLIPKVIKMVKSPKTGAYVFLMNKSSETKKVQDFFQKIIENSIYAITAKSSHW